MLSGRYRLGRYIVDFDARKVSLGGRKLSLHWRGFEALRELAEARGQVVARDRLFQVLWPGAVVDESYLGKVISQLRRTLDEGDPGTQHVETLPGVGYRLTPPIEPVPAGASASAAAASRPWRRIAAGAGMAAAVVAVWAALAWWPERQRELEARDAMGRGNDLLRIRDTARADEAVAWFRRATELNPRSAEAFSALAQALDRHSSAVGTPLGLESPALLAARRAVELDPDCAGCNGTLGQMLLTYAWQWDGALHYTEKATRLNPHNYGIRPAYALALLVKGRGNEALRQIDIAIEGSPYHAGYHSIRARTLYMLKRYPEAIEAADRLRGIQPTDLGGWEWRSQALLQMGRVPEGIEAMTAKRFESHAAAASDAVRKGGLAAGLRVLIEATADSPKHSWRRARWKAILGDDGAMAELETAFQARAWELMFVAVDPVFERYRGEARFQRLLQEMGLEPTSSRQSSERPRTALPATP